MIHLRFRGLATALVLINIAVSGCGGDGTAPPLSQVSGIVKLDGAPLAKASVTFQPVGKGRPSFGITDENGRYTLKFSERATGAIYGRHQVQISTWQEGYDNKGSWIPSVPERVPAKYNEGAKDSPEMARDVAGRNLTIDFSLDSNAGPITQRYEPSPARTQ